MSEILTQLNEKRRRVRLFYTLHLLLLVTLVVMLVQQQFTVAIALAALAVGFYLSVVRPAMKALEGSFNRESISLAVGRQADFRDYAERRTDIVDALRQDRLLPLPEKGVLALHLASAAYQGLPVELMDAVLPILPKGARAATGTRFLCGVWTRIELPASPAISPLRVASTELLAAYDLDSYYREGLPKDISQTLSGADRAQLAWYHAATEAQLPEAFKDAVQALAEYTPGEIALSLEGNRLNVFIKSRFMVGRAPLFKKQITEELLAYDQFPEFSRILSVVDTLRST